MKYHLPGFSRVTDAVQGWRDHPPGYQVMFVRYEFLDDAWDDICDFVGIAAEPRLDFKPRRSDWQALPSPQREQLDAIYGELASTIERYPAVEII